MQGGAFEQPWPLEEPGTSSISFRQYDAGSRHSVRTGYATPKVKTKSGFANRTETETCAKGGPEREADPLGDRDVLEEKNEGDPSRRLNFHGKQEVPKYMAAATSGVQNNVAFTRALNYLATTRYEVKVVPPKLDNRDVHKRKVLYTFARDYAEYCHQFEKEQWQYIFDPDRLVLPEQCIDAKYRRQAVMKRQRRDNFNTYDAALQDFRMYLLAEGRYEDQRQLRAEGAGAGTLRAARHKDYLP